MRRGRKGFNPHLYRLRGKGVFGGKKTRLNGCLRELSEGIAIKMV